MEEKAWPLVSVLCQERRHKDFGARFRVFRHWTASTFELKDLPSSQRHYMAESSNTTSSQNQTSASSKLPDKSLELESHQHAYIQSTPHILHTHHGSKPSRRWLACSMGTICSTHYSFEEFKRIFHVQSEISCELNIKMKTWNTGLHIIELSLRDKM